jgi:hypothetical protein
MRRAAAITFGISIVSVWLLFDRGAAASNSLVGWAMLSADTYADGPTSGQFAGPGRFGHALPVVDRQTVQGFSAVIGGPVPGTYDVIIDNGFGTKANSADSLLRVYTVRPGFRTAAGGEGTVSAADYRTGVALPSFTPASYITLHDPDKKLGFRLVADMPTYPGVPAGIPVAPAIVSGRLLTGADLDIESIRRDKDGHLWFGDEFGPFLFQTDASGKVLGPEVQLPGVWAPENPHRGDRAANLGSSLGFEGLAINRAGDTLFGLIEGTVAGDIPKVLRLHEFAIRDRRFTGRTFGYRLDPLGTNIGDMTAVTDRQFLVVERNNAFGTATDPAPFKKIFLVDTSRLDADGMARKTEVIDLMNVGDPDDLNRDGSTTFTFPFITIEDVMVVNPSTVLVINDNNYPGGGGRGAFSDNTEFLLIRLATALPARP